MSDAPEKRERSSLARVLLLVGLIAVALWFGQSWAQRAVEVELVHRFPGGESLPPSDVEVMVWEDDVLHANATFYSPETLDEIAHTIAVPPGDYTVTYAVVQEFGSSLMRFENTLEVDEAGRYYLHYEQNE